MATIAAVNVNFTAATQNLEKGTKRAERIVRSFSTSVTSFSALGIPGIGNLISGAGITVLVRKTIAEFKEQFSNLSLLSDQSLNLGIDPQQLQHLQFASQQAGVSAESFAGAIGKMQRNIADAADGTGEAGDALKKLGLDGQKLAGLTPDKQLRLIADGIAKMQGPTQRVQAAMDIFGRSGVSLLATLEGGSAGLDEMADKARRLGANLTEVDVQLGDLADDALGQVGFAFDNLMKQFAVELAPAVTVLAESFAELIGGLAGGTGGTYALSFALISFVGTIGDVVEEIVSLKRRLTTVQGLRETFLNKEIEAAWNRIFGTGARLAEDFADDFGMDEFKRQMHEAGNEFFSVARGLDRQAEAAAKPPFSERLVARLEQTIKRGEDAARKAEERRVAASKIAAGAKPPKDVTPKALEAGTAAAVNEINKILRGKDSDIPKQQLREQQKGNEIARDVLREIRENRAEAANLDR